MNSNLKYFLQTLSVIAVICIGHYLFLQKNRFNTPKIVHTSDTTISIKQRLDTNTYVMNISNEYITNNKTIILPSKIIDTQALINDYYTQKISNTNYIDTNVNITITDTLYKNRLLGRALKYKLLRPETTITKHITNTTTITKLKNNNGIYIGALFSPNFGLSPSATYVRQKWIIGSGISYSNKQLYPFVNFQLKIK